MRLLIIEGSAEVRQRVCQLLTTIPNVEIQTETSLAGGRKWVRQQQPDIIVLDAELSDGQGIEFLRTVKHEHPATQVFVFTNSVFLRKKCRAAGADRFFDKSMEFNALVNAVGELTER